MVPSPKFPMGETDFLISRKRVKIIPTYKTESEDTMKKGEVLMTTRVISWGHLRQYYFMSPSKYNRVHRPFDYSLFKFSLQQIIIHFFIHTYFMINHFL